MFRSVKQFSTNVMLQISRDMNYFPINVTSGVSPDITYSPIRALSNQSCEDVMYCRDRGYLTTHVTSLPRLCRLSDNVPRAFVNYARTDQLDEMKRMILLAEERGDGVGKGEFTTESERSDYLFERSEIFAICLEKVISLSSSLETGAPTTDVAAFIAISPCLYARTYDPCLASVRVFRSTHLAADDHTYRSLVHLAVQLTDEINCGYTHAVVDVALCHVNFLRQLKEEGFHVTAIIPDSVYVNGVGACENAILVKRFRQNDRPVRPLSAVLEMLKRMDPCDEFMKHYPGMSLPQIHSLPLRHRFDSGVEAIFRNMRKDEDEKLFWMMTEAVKQGQGYAVNEYPSLDYFRKHRLARCRTVVMEDVANQHIIGFFNIGDTRFTRGWKPGERSCIIISLEYRTKAIASDATRILGSLVLELGYPRCIENTFISNSRAKSTIQHMLASTAYVGTIPNAGYLQPGPGWEDLLVLNISNDRAQAGPTFPRLVEKNAANHVVRNNPTAKL